MTQILAHMQLFDGAVWSDDQAVVVEGHHVAEILPLSEVADDVTHDLGGAVLAPGFFDVQVNGGGGVMFNDAQNQADLARMLGGHLQFGTTQMLPTLISDSWQEMIRHAELIATARASGMQGIVGLHFEGPYLNPHKRGVHAADQLRPIDAEVFNLLEDLDLGAVMMTVAPECVEPADIVRLRSLGVVISAGHSAATYDQAVAGFSAGISGVTHLYNAMSGLVSRAPGLVGAVLDQPGVYCGIIADGYHVHPASLRIALAAKDADHMVLVTDAMATVGAETKSFKLYGQDISAVEGRCATAEGTLAGSDLNMMAAVRYAVTDLEVPLGQALRMGSLNPARWMGVDAELGRIAQGRRADFVVIAPDLTLNSVWQAGQESQKK